MPAKSDSHSRALEDAAIIEAGLAAVKEWEAEHGPISAEILEWADKILEEALGPSEGP